MGRVRTKSFVERSMNTMFIREMQKKETSFVISI